MALQRWHIHTSGTRRAQVELLIGNHRISRGVWQCGVAGWDTICGSCTTTSITHYNDAAGMPFYKHPQKIVGDVAPCVQVSFPRQLHPATRQDACTQLQA
jgi:hypothetical protein